MSRHQTTRFVGIALSLMLGITAACSKTDRTKAKYDTASLSTATITSSAAAPPPVAPSPERVSADMRRDLSAQSAGEGSADAVVGSALGERPAPGSMRVLSTTGTLDPSMVIRTAQASVEVHSLMPAIGRARSLATRVGGYVGSSSMTAGRDEPRTAQLEIRVPAERFDDAVAGLEPLGTVESVSSTAEDVGEEFVDVTARVANARRLEARLLDLLATRTGKLSDIVEVERQLAQVREEIERYEGRLRFLRARTAVSTIQLTLHEPAPLLGDRPVPNPIVEAVARAWHNMLSMIAGLIALLGALIPLAAIGGAIWWIGRRLGVRLPTLPPAQRPTTIKPEPVG